MEPDDSGDESIPSEPLWASERIVSDSIARLMELWGFKRNMGRAWTVLYLAGEPLTAKQLRARLQLSSGAVSMTLNELGRWGVVRKMWVQGDRRDFFEAEANIWKMVSRVMREREQSEIGQAIEAFEEALVALDRQAEEDAAAPPARVRLQPSGSNGCSTRQARSFDARRADEQRAPGRQLAPGLPARPQVSPRRASRAARLRLCPARPDGCPPTRAKPAVPRWRRLLPLLGLVLLGWVLSRLDLGGMGAALGRIAPSVIALACGLFAVNFFVKALRWQRLLRAQGIEMPWRVTFAAFMSGQF